MLLSAIVSTLLNILILAGVPFLIFYLYEKIRRKINLQQILLRAGLRLTESRFILYSLGFAALVLLILIVHPPSLTSLLQNGSAQRPFAGLGITATSVAMALLYGILKTGFAEELLFRGIIAGALARRLPLAWANLIQSLVFLLPHLVVLRLMPAPWQVLPLIILGALFVGWIRMKSGSILGPWLVHSTLNVALCLYVAHKSAH